ncbi:hypothetical protein [Streptomyces sp. NPDC058084]|uniref:hypothetical protein n=1 Tax=Streptomyces sp. NPDC058084 TaxID=3346333 RepID=UPI0036E3F6BA
MGGDGGGHDLLVQAGVTAAAAQDEGEVAAGFGKQAAGQTSGHVQVMIAGAAARAAGH